MTITRSEASDGRSWLFAFNHGDGTASVPASGIDLLTALEVPGALELPPGGYAVIREDAG